MLGFLPLAALAAADNSGLVSGNLCVSRHRLVQDEWCQFNCNSERPNCPTDTCTCEGTISFAGASTINVSDAPSSQQAEQVAPSHANRTLQDSSLGNSSLGNTSLANSSLANSSSSESEALRESVKLDRKDWRRRSGRRSAGVNGPLVLYGHNDGQLGDLAAQIVDKFFHSCQKAHGSACSLAQTIQQGALVQHENATDAVADANSRRS